MLTSSQLFDLVKAKKLATHTGPRGGRYYVSESGEKIYVGQGVGIKIAPGPVDVRLQGQMHVRPERHMINWPTSRTVAKIAQEHWPAYVCRSCRQPVVPRHTAPILTGIHSATHGVGPARIVETEEGELEARPEKVGETVRVRIMDPKTRKIRTEYGWKPEWVATRLCDKCYGKKSPSIDQKRQQKQEAKTTAHIEAGMQRHRQLLTLRKESARAYEKIRREAERVARRKKVKKSVDLWVTL